MIAILVAIVAVVIALISLTATGTLAVRLRMVTPQRERPPGGGSLQPASIPTRGQDIAEVLGPLAEVTVGTRAGPAVMTDTYLTDDGCVLVVATACGTCRRLLRESREVLAARPVRVLVTAPTTERGIEFIENDCLGAGLPYQVDPGAARARALGLTDFPSVLVIDGGVLTAAYAVGTLAQLRQALSPQERHEGGGWPVRQGMLDGR